MITVYSKPGCGGCQFTKMWLEKNNIEFVEIDVTKDPQGMQDIKDYGFKSLPVVSVGSLDNAWTGYDEARLSELLGSDK